MDASNYTGPLTAAELADWKKRHGNGYAADRAAAWSACQCDKQPEAAHAASEINDAPRKKKMPLAIAIPLIGSLVPIFFLLAWACEFMPSVRTVLLLIANTFALILAAILIARWLH
jgi:hypothetical protein